jgi:hypothetical protein
MFKALLYKEWIKLRLYWVLLLVANVGFAAFLALRLRHVFTINGALMVWGSWIFKGYLFFRSYQYVPLLTGIVLGGLQFFPEIQNRRLQLVLHLPLGEARAVASHLVAGLVLLTALYGADVALMAGTAAGYFPSEFQGVFCFTAVPWLLAGYGAYLLTAAVLLEPTWRARVFFFVLGGSFLRLFYLDDFYNAYARVLGPLVLWTAALFLLPLLSARRFAKGDGSSGGRGIARGTDRSQTAPVTNPSGAVPVQS